jgi:YVTN family beta-propeller protein
MISVGAAKQRALLAILALHANTSVSADRLIEGLWGERAPPTAAKTMQVYMSRLRKALEGGDAAIVTRGRGYELRLDPDAVDAVRFEREVGEAIRTGRPGRAREALVLWRGSPLQDVADEPFAAAQIRRLEELRLRARELAIDGSLRAGEHLAALGEIEQLIADEPLSERPRAQQMLALYRAGRQADALAAYRDLRALLVDELGIEPGPELRSLHDAILRQDPALDLPTPAPRPAVPAGGPEERAPVRRRSRAIAATVILAAVLGAGLVLLLGGGGSDTPAETTVPPDSVVIIDPRTNAVSGALRLPTSPGPITAADDMVWVLSPGNATVARIDARTRRILETAGAEGQEPPGNIVAAPGNVWIAEGCQQGSSGALVRLETTHKPFSIPEEAVLIPLESAAGTSPARPVPPSALQTGPGCGLAATSRSVWTASYVPPGLARVDIAMPADYPHVARVVRLPFITTAIAVGAGSLWARDTRRSVVWRMDPRTLARRRDIQTGSDPAAIAVGAGAVWVANSGDGSVSHIDPRSNAVTRAISVGDTPLAVAVGPDAVWVANSGDGTVSRIDPRTDRVAATITVGHHPQGVAVAAGAVWVSLRR